MGKKVIGIDFGTLSARCVILDVDNGKMCGTDVYEYPHAVMSDKLPDGTTLPYDYALAFPQDYRDALINTIKNSMQQADVSKDDIVGFGLDATTFSLVACDKEGNAMCEHDAYKSEPMAYIKLWKHHAAVPQSDKFQEAHDKTGGIPAVARYGGKFNCEWALPKLLETYEKAPDLFKDTYRFCDLGDWITRMLTGKFTNSLYTLGFKTYWAPDSGKPSKEALDYVADGFAKALDEKFWGEPISHFEACGYLTDQMAEQLGLNPGLPIAAAMGDGSIPGVYFCINNPQSLALTYGTSIAMSFLTDKLHEISGINGVVKDAIVPGFVGWDAGQPCAGDMLGWFVDNQVPSSYEKAAQAQNMNVHDYLTKLAIDKKPYNNELTVLDWWNGNRGILNDLSLRGAILGYSLNTKPEDLYCAMLQGIACGNRKICDHLADNGVIFDKIIICGGIAKKNHFAIEQFANIYNRKMYISQADDITACSSAILAAVVSGVPMKDAAKNMTSDKYIVVEPDLEHQKEYQAIYKRWCKYHDKLK